MNIKHMVIQAVVVVLVIAIVKNIAPVEAVLKL
jgi:hypothetical protein